MKRHPEPAHAPAMRLASASLIACTALALANLPGDDLPPGWLLAFVLPGAVLARVTPWTPRPWQRVLLAVVLQALACWAALAAVGPMSRPAALACTILPPLGFAAARQQEADQALALFLSFCVLLVGAILDGLHVPLIAGYGACACVSLRCANHLAVTAMAAGARQPRPRVAVGSVLGGVPLLVVAALAAVLVLDRGQAALPSPSRGERATGAAEPAPSSQRRTGLDDAFVLDGSGGVLSELTGEQLVRVHRPDGAPLKPDLYLRSGFFTLAGLDRWQLGSLDLSPPTSDHNHVLRPPRSAAATQYIELDRFAGARNFVFVPPGTCEIRGLLDVVLDRSREWARQRLARDTGPYQALFQDLGPLARSDEIEKRARVRDLLELPRGLDRTRYEALLTEWGIGTAPHDAIRDVAAALARHCRYDRLEPVGPHATALDNFLFAPADRRGYCMHFASAAALLLRLRGVPCRIGVGLYGGDPDRADANARVFGSQHAHAWVEVPVAGRGYVVFDPTPAPDRGQRMPSRFAEPDGTDDAADTAATASGGLLVQLVEFLSRPWVPAALLALALAAVLLPRGSQSHGNATPPVARSARRLLGRLLQALAAAGHPRARGQTLEAFAKALARADRLQPEVRAAFASYQEVRFGGRAFDAMRERSLRDGIDAAAAMRAANDVT